MPNIKSAFKRDKQNQKKRLRNRIYRGRARTYVRKAQGVIEDGSLEEARSATLEAISALDKAAEKGVIHRNNASRRKGRLMKRLAKLEKENV